MLKLQFRQHPEQYTKLAPPVVTIGRDPKNHLVVDDPTVSDFHAEIRLENGELQIADLLSASGTFINGTLIKGNCLLKAWDVIRVGKVELEINDPNKHRPDAWVLRTASDLLAGQHVTLLAKTVVGRDPECDFPIQSEHLSRRHAELHIEGDKLRVVDLQSRNGTFLNGKRISEAFAQPGDELLFDRHLFIVAGPAPKREDAEPGADEETKLRRQKSDTTVVQPDPDATVFQAADQTLIADFGDRTRAWLIAQDDVPGVPGRIDISSRSFTIGRGASNDLVLADQGISKQHVKLVEIDGEWVMEDQNSRNGVFLNGKRTQHATLKDGDLIRLGKYEFQFSPQQGLDLSAFAAVDRTQIFIESESSTPAKAGGRSRSGTGVKRAGLLPAWGWGALMLLFLGLAAAAAYLWRGNGF